MTILFYKLAIYKFYLFMMENSKNNIPYVDESNVILDKPIGIF